MVGSANDGSTVVNVANGDDGVKAMEEDADTTGGWDLNKVWVYTDPDGNKVPVPKGFTVSGAESERYVNHNVTKTGTLSDLTWSSSGDYAWTHNLDDGVWISGNYNVTSENTVSELVSNEFIVGKDGGYLSIEWSVSSYTSTAGINGLLLTITNLDTGMVEEQQSLSGTCYGTNYNSLVYTKFNQELEKGKYIITISYNKIGRLNRGLEKGFVKSGSVTNYDSEGTEIVIIHQYGGLVIYDGIEPVNDANAWIESKNRNQFVWVPVENANRIYETDSITKKKNAKLYTYSGAERTTIPNASPKREAAAMLKGDYIRSLIQHNLQGNTKDLLYKDLESEFSKTVESIEKYGGFYIGRYETGNVDETVPVVRRMNEAISNQSWYNMYLKMKNISNNTNIQTGMIWGCLFDETVQWLIETGEKTQVEAGVDSTSWGNFYNASFEYTDSNGNILTKSIEAFHSTMIPTGSTERNKANNIYDIAGNVSDWTLEYIGATYYNSIGARAIRGGSYMDFGCITDYAPAGRYTTNYSSMPNVISKSYGFRAYFYIK